MKPTMLLPVAVGAFATCALAACGPSVTPTAQVACAEVGPAVLAKLTGDLTVAGGGTISAATYIELAAPAGGEAVWYAVAARLEGPGMNGLRVVWVTTANLPGDDSTGEWFSIDDMAREFSTHPAAVDVPSAVMAADPERAAGCLP